MIFYVFYLQINVFNIYDLNGFNIKRFAHLYCLRVLFLGMHWHWLKRHAEAFRQSDEAATRRPILLLFWKYIVLNSTFLVN